MHLLPRGRNTHHDVHNVACLYHHNADVGMSLCINVAVATIKFKLSVQIPTPYVTIIEYLLVVIMLKCLIVPCSDQTPVHLRKLSQ